jgi:hypothetical protein
MSHLNIHTLEDAARATSVWSDTYEAPARFGDIAMALLPASLILATATALLVALL